MDTMRSVIQESNKKFLWGYKLNQKLDTILLGREIPAQIYAGFAVLDGRYDRMRDRKNC